MEAKFGRDRKVQFFCIISANSWPQKCTNSLKNRRIITQPTSFCQKDAIHHGIVPQNTVRVFSN